MYDKIAEQRYEFRYDIICLHRHFIGRNIAFFDIDTDADGIIYNANLLRIFTEYRIDTEIISKKMLAYHHLYDGITIEYFEPPLLLATIKRIVGFWVYRIIMTYFCLYHLEELIS